MKYSKGINYQLEEDETVETGLIGRVVLDKWYTLGATGKLTIRKGYGWDGTSGAFDTDTLMRASLFHDALCQMIGNKELPIGAIDAANNLYYELCRADGMNWIRAKWQLRGIRLHFRNGVMPKGDREILIT